MIIRLISCVGVRHDLPMLPHFLRHYLALGIAPEHMHILLQAHEPSPRLEAARDILRQAGIDPGNSWIADYTSDAMWEKRRELQRRHAAPGDWVISADVDELHEYPAPLPVILDWCERRRINCIQGPFVDRLAARGVLAPVAQAPAVAAQFPVQADVICHIRGRGIEPDFHYGTVKIMALKGDLMPSRGGHHPRADGVLPRYMALKPLADFWAIRRPAFRFALPLQVHHYKWVDTLIEATRRRLDTAGVSPAGKEYGETLIDYFARDGRIAINQVAIRRSAAADRIPWRLRIAALRLLARAENMLAGAGR